MESTTPTEGSAETDRSADSATVAASGEGLTGKTLYEVQEGETLYGICLKIYGSGSKLEEICELNGLDDENKIISGQNLILP